MTEKLFRSLPCALVVPTLLSNESENLINVSITLGKLKAYNKDISGKIAEESGVIDLAINKYNASEEEELMQKYIK